MCVENIPEASMEAHQMIVNWSHRRLHGMSMNLQNQDKLNIIQQILFHVRQSHA